MEAIPEAIQPKEPSALLSRTSGIYNTGIGIYSLLSVTDGDANTGVGAGTLLANTAGENTAMGAGALFSNTTGRRTRPTASSPSFSTPKATPTRPMVRPRS